MLIVVLFIVVLVYARVATLVMDGIPAGGFLCFLIMSEWSMNIYMPVFSLDSLWPLHFPETSQYRCIPYDHLRFLSMTKVNKCCSFSQNIRIKVVSIIFIITTLFG